MKKQDLMNCVRNCSCPCFYESYYRFAHDFILRLETEGNADNGIIHYFLNALAEIQNILKGRNTEKKETLKRALGISGNKFDMALSWCDEMSEFVKNNAGRMTAKELDYVMGMCARMCKVNKNHINITLMASSNNHR